MPPWLARTSESVRGSLHPPYGSRQLKDETLAVSVTVTATAAAPPPSTTLSDGKRKKELLFVRVCIRRSLTRSLNPTVCPSPLSSRSALPRHVYLPILLSPVLSENLLSSKIVNRLFYRVVPAEHNEMEFLKNVAIFSGHLPSHNFPLPSTCCPVTLQQLSPNTL